MTKAGAAGLMGNLKAYSGIRSVFYENAYKKKIGLSDQEYVDQVGFGLALWTYHTRKQALFNTCRENIGSLDCQLKYLVAELKAYFSKLNQLLRSSSDVRTCTIGVIVDFERPLSMTQAAKNRRISSAMEYFNGYWRNKDIIFIK